MQRIGRFVRARTAEDAWLAGLGLIWRHGDVLTDERGAKTKELMNLMVTIEDVSECIAPEGYAWGTKCLDLYASQLLSPENPGFEYTYGERLWAWNGEVDQISEIIRRIKSHQATRRATAVTLVPPVDHKKDEVPCMVVCDFKVRGGLLHMNVMFRSHDFAGAYPANMYALTKLLHHVSGETGIQPGSITTFSVSAHIYEHDWDMVMELVQ